MIRSGLTAATCAAVAAIATFLAQEIAHKRNPSANSTPIASTTTAAIAAIDARLHRLEAAFEAPRATP